MNPQLDLFSSRAARDIALSTVAEHSGTFIDEALAIIQKLPDTWTGTGEDVRHICQAQGVTPHHPNANGALINTAVKRGLLIPTDRFVQMREKSSHARVTRVYRRSDVG